MQYSKDKLGNTYGDEGFKSNFRLTETGDEEAATGYACIGYLEADMNAVIRIKGISFDGAAGSYLCLYDSAGNLVKTVTLSGKADKKNGITYEGAITKFVPADATTDLSSMVYFRVSGIGSASNLIITYCEEIK